MVKIEHGIKQTFSWSAHLFCLTGKELWYKSGVRVWFSVFPEWTDTLVLPGNKTNVVNLNYCDTGWHCYTLSGKPQDFFTLFITLWFSSISNLKSPAGKILGLIACYHRLYRLVFWFRGWGKIFLAFVPSLLHDLFKQRTSCLTSWKANACNSPGGDVRVSDGEASLFPSRGSA